MKLSAVLASVAVALAGTSALANDTMANLGAGGLVFITTPDIKMLSEDLYVSPTAVRVQYQFRNDGAEDVDALVAFPLPDITGSGDFMVSIPTEDTENIFGFTTSFEGAPVDAELHQYVFAENIEYTDFLKGLGVPLTPYGEATQTAIDALDEETKAELLHRGLVVPIDYSTGNDVWQRSYYPVWTLRSTYSWEAHFPAGETVDVEHSYTPSLGGTVAVTFMGEPYEGSDPMADAQKKYCVDDAFVRTVEKSLRNKEDRYSAPYFEQWLQYVWSTGSNWSGSIGKFRLVIDKGDPKNLVSFCWDGEVKKIGPTTFEATAEDFFPPYGRELEIMLLDYQEPEGTPSR